MLDHIKIGVLSQLDKKLYLALCGAASPDTLEYCESAFFSLHKGIVSGKIGADVIANILKDPLYAQAYLESESLFNKERDQKNIHEDLQAVNKKIEEHAEKSDASFRKLIFNASLFVVLPVSLLTNVTTSFFNEEIVAARQAIVRKIKGKPAALPKGVYFIPSHAPLNPLPYNKPKSRIFARTNPVPCI